MEINPCVCSKVCLLSFQTSFSISQSSTWPNGELFNWWTELFNQWRKIKSVVFSLKVALYNCACSTRGERRGGTGGIQFESVQEDRRKRGKGNLSWNASRAGKRRILQSTSWVQILTILLWNYSRYLRYLQYFKILQSTSDTYNTSSLFNPYNIWETFGKDEHPKCQ